MMADYDAQADSKASYFAAVDAMRVNSMNRYEMTIDTGTGKVKHVIRAVSEAEAYLRVKKAQPGARVVNTRQLPHKATYEPVPLMVPRRLVQEAARRMGTRKAEK